MDCINIIIKLDTMKIIKFNELMKKVVSIENEIDVLFEHEDNESKNGGTWVCFNFDSINECIEYFVDNHFTFVGNNGNKLKDKEPSDFNIDNNKLYIEMDNGYTFIFPNKKLCKKFNFALQKFI